STRRTDDDFANEIDAHLALEIERLIDEGKTPEEARLAARRQFGSVAAAKERFYEARRWMWIDHLRQDVRYAFRGIARYPIAAGAALAAATPARMRDVRTADRTETVRIRSATPEFFSILGVDAAIGSTATGAAGAVLSHNVWQLMFGGRADAIGQPLWIDNQP